MLHFANYEKRTEYDEERGKWICSICYDKEDEPELLIDVLSFGPVVRVLGPEAVGENAALITRDLETILTDHGLTSRGIQVAQLKTPLTLTEVFPRLFDGKGGVDVRA